MSKLAGLRGPTSLSPAKYWRPTTQLVAATHLRNLETDRLARPAIGAGFAALTFNLERFPAHLARSLPHSHAAALPSKPTSEQGCGPMESVLFDSNSIQIWAPDALIEHGNALNDHDRWYASLKSMTN